MLFPHIVCVCLLTVSWGAAATPDIRHELPGVSFDRSAIPRLNMPVLEVPASDGIIRDAGVPSERDACPDLREDDRECPDLALSEPRERLQF
jgi:hypothetical protein